jgi:hypothetical protein
VRSTSRKQAPEVSQKQGDETAPQCIIAYLLALIERDVAHAKAFFSLQECNGRLA